MMPWMRLQATVTRLAMALIVLALAGAASGPAAVSDAAEEGWLIRSFEASFTVSQDGSLLVTEDIQVDFLDLPSHGIFREIPVEYRYSERYNRLISLTEISVEGAAGPMPVSVSRQGANLQLKIGDPGRLVTGVQLYRIRYRAHGALNAFENHDELYWNVTGNQWPVTIERATAVVHAPSVVAATCFQSRVGSGELCRQRERPDGRLGFVATRQLHSGEGLTIVVGMAKGAVQVPPPTLVYVKTDWEKLRDAAGLKPIPVAAAIGLGVFGLALVGRLWWLAGRDRWYGDVHYLTGSTQETIRPFFARETVVVEYQPPDLPDRRRLRPAEIGLLLDERADTLDVSATIVDLAARGCLHIYEEPGRGLFGRTDYRLEKRASPGPDALPYERRLFNALFAGRSEVAMSDLKDRFYKDLAEVKKDLYRQAVDSDHLFPRDPEAVRTIYLVGGLVVAGAGIGLAVLAAGIGAAVLGLPLVLAGLTVALLHRAMPRRTALGRELFRRCLGFREYMVTAETDRQRFAEEQNLFTRYLPYAIVFGCTEKWAEAFEGLESRPAETQSWYSGPGPFRPVLFAGSVDNFSRSVSRAIASTPAGSGSSGFSGGSSGGGFGGGGGGRW